MSTRRLGKRQQTKRQSSTSLVITPGDPEGIGPEVTAKALSALYENPKSLLRHSEILIFGSKKPFVRYRHLIKNIPIHFIEPPHRSSPGFQSGWAVDSAARFVMGAPRNRLLVTGPISKERLQGAGFIYNGHTDFLAAIAKIPQVSMMLANDRFRVLLATDHVPLAKVSKHLNPKHLDITFTHAYGFAKDLLKRKKPRIAVLGLNPHAGEHGILGTEEQKIILPAMKAFSKKFNDVDLTGPHSADSFFAIENGLKPTLRHDVIVAMYHDQGLIPVKLADFSNSLNVTLGLPFIRTSVDHGTAFNIAGKNKADPGSMIYAINKGVEYLSTFSKINK
jgi:4-hydroxythreonine-4-phosphate dehydrogenase